MPIEGQHFNFVTSLVFMGSELVFEISAKARPRWMMEDYQMMRHIALGAAVAFVLPVSALASPAMVANSAMGKILTDAQGMALYTFTKDTKDHSVCNGGCAALWPPLKASASDKATGKYTIFKRADGTLQWAFNGKPLYTFAKDTKKDQVTGDGFRGVWHVAKPIGGSSW